MAPIFEHHDRQALPIIESDGITLRLILGTAYGETAPATLFSEAFYADVTLAPHTLMPLPDGHEDRGLSILEGALSIAGQDFTVGQMMVFRPGDRITVAAQAAGARLMILGGATLGRAALHLVELRRVLEGAHRVGEGAMAGRGLGRGLFDLPMNDRAEHTPLPEQKRTGKEADQPPCPLRLAYAAA